MSLTLLINQSAIGIPNLETTTKKVVERSGALNLAFYS